MQMHFWKGAKFAGSVGHPMTKMLSASGSFASMTRGFAPGPRWGLCPQTPVIGSCSALAIVPQPLTPTAYGPSLEKILWAPLCRRYENGDEWSKSKQWRN